MLNIDFDGRLWRACFVAALALTLFVLARYWLSLRVCATPLRVLLISLRGLSLLLVACALAGLHVNYDGPRPQQILFYRDTRNASEEVTRGSAQKSLPESKNNDVDSSELFSALAEQGIKSVRLGAFSDAPLSDAETNAATTAAAKSNDYFNAAVLLTNGAMPSKEAARMLNELSAKGGGVPVFVVAAFDTDTASPARVALQSASPVSKSIWRGVPVTVRCRVHGRGMSGRESLLTITDDTQVVRASTKVRWTKNDEWQTVWLQIVPKTVGWTNYAAHLEGAGSEDAATLARTFAVYAEDHRLRVLFFEGEPTWEAKFIRRALGESGLFDTDYFAQVSRASAVGIAANRKSNEAANADEDVALDASVNSGVENKKSQSTENDSGRDAPEAKLHEALGSAARLNAYDCVVVGATPDALLSAAEALRLREWVERRGGGLIVLGGNSFGGSIAVPNGKLYSMLPAEIDARQLTSELQQRSLGVPLEASEASGKGIALTPTETGAGGALQGYREALEAAAQASHKNAAANEAAVLSGAGFQLRALRAGAFSLATSGAAGANRTIDASQTLIAAMRDGAGRTVLFAPADSWRIRTNASSGQDETADAFTNLWQGLALWSASGARASVELALSDDSPGAGSEVIAELQARDASFATIKIEKVSAQLQKINDEGEENSANAAQDSVEVAFAPDKNDASLWRARFIAQTRGRFVLQVRYTTAGGKSMEASKLFAIVEPTALEAGAARDTLYRLARESGGEVFDSTDMRGLAEKLSHLPRHNEKTRRIWELRAWWPLALIISLLLAAEWFARRWWQID